MSSDQAQPGRPDPESAATGDQPAMKACPDCAESVLAAARICRYCGYRFDGRQPAAWAPAPPQGVFAGLLRRSAPPLTLAQTVRQLGVELGPDEQPSGLWLGQVEGDNGYVLLTSERLLFITGLRPSKDAPAPRQHQLSELASAEIAARRWKASLVLHWRDAADLSIDGLVHKDLQALHAALLERVDR